MPFVESHPQGRFCWLELGTTDRLAAVGFYTRLFGWSTVDAPMDRDVYTTFKLKDHSAGAVYQMGKEMSDQGIPPHWLLYASVEDVDAAAARVAPLGGTIMMGPFDVMEHGRMAVVRDPQGAVFGLWQSKSHHGLTIIDEPGAFCWPELNTSDAGAALNFYKGLFHWDHKTEPMGGSAAYTELRDAKGPVGGLMQIQPQWGPVPPHWMAYIQVADCGATVAQAQEFGGKVVVPPMDIPEVGRFAQLQDPQGAHFSVIQMNRM